MELAPKENGIEDNSEHQWTMALLLEARQNSS